MTAVAVLGLALGGFAAAIPTLAASAATIGTPVITDSLTGTVTGPDAIVDCATTPIAIGGTQAVAVPVACLTEFNGEWYQVSWTGTGVSIAANKVRGVRAALCTDGATAEGARRWNDANVLAMGLRLTTATTAVEMLDAFIGTEVDDSERSTIDGVEPA